MEIPARSSYFAAGLALTTASALAFTPLVSPNASPRDIALPHISTPSMQLTAAITPADITALINGLDNALDAVSPTVTNVARVPGQTLVGALDAAVGLNNTLWDQLIAATNNPALINVLTALRAVSSGGLSELAASVGTINDTVTLTTGQVASLLTSTVTGSVATAQHALATVTSNPLAAYSYTGLINVPLNIAGLALNTGLAAARDLGVNGLALGNTMVHAVTAQITNIVSAVNDLTSRGVTGVPLFDGVVNAVQAIALSPVTVGVAGVNGLTDTLTEAGSTAWTRITNGAGAAVTTWLGNGTDAGAVEAAINKIWAEPLSAAAYADAASVIVSAVINTGQIAVGTVGSMASLPFSMGADLTTTGADMVKTLNSNLATAAAALMHAAGLPPYMSNLPHVLAGAVNGAITIAAAAASATLNGIAAAIDIGNTLTGAMPVQRVLTLNVATDSPSLTAVATSTEPASDTDTEPSSETETAAKAANDTLDDTAATAQPIEEAEPIVAEEATPVDETPPAPTADEIAGQTSQTPTTPAAEATKATDTQTVTESDETTTGDTTPTESTPTTRTSTSDEQQKTTKPTTTDPVERTQPKDETSKDPDTRDEAKKPNDKDDSSRTTAGARHAQDTVKNGTSVNEIKSRIDKETSPTADDQAA